MNQYINFNNKSKLVSDKSSINLSIGKAMLIDKDGTVHFEPYSPTSDSTKIGTNLTDLPTAIPLDSSSKYYPLSGELILIFKGPSPKSVLSQSSTQNYYVTINLWNNTNNNAQFGEQEITFEQKDVPLLQTFAGDKIINGRYGNNIRFSSTNLENNNFWNEGKNGDQIIILSNTSGSLENIEEDNLLILSSAQKIPLKTFTLTSNKITQTILPKNSSLKSQFLNAERIVLNTLKDDILLYSYKNAEIYSKNNITLNTDRILLNAGKICLGQDESEEPTEPAVLGNQLEDLMRSLLKAMTSFSNKLSSAISTPVGTPLISISSAATVLTNDLQKSISKLDKIKSKTVYLK